VEVYKDLSEVERALSGLKDVIEMRPIYHQTAPRVQAHIFIASLAFLLGRALEKKPQAAEIDLSSKEAWSNAENCAGGERKQSVTQGSSRAAQILRSLGIKDLDPDAGAAHRRGSHSDTSKNAVLYFQ
jgi:transposase